ncbi:ABC transporter permease [Spirochaetia bacterium 38H-sp]|uniref:ABC transporter permease n=1 Tax=Rarispira pelagica TaxID=3141764 RepID=A0ABU9UCC0_9SPIR
MIIRELISQFPLILPHLYATILTGIGGFIISIFIGFLMALFLDFSSAAKLLLYPILVVSQTIPIIFMYPLFLIWFGYGIASKLFVVILVCFFPVSVSLTDGLASTDSELLLLFRSFNASRIKTFFYLRLPSAIPSLFSGLKIAATYSIMGAVIGEWLGASRGLGVYMLRAYKTFSTPRVFAAIIIVVAASLIVVYLVKKAEQLLLPWIQKAEGFSAKTMGKSLEM